ncbi:hypothetical protein ccbrp13_70430 [Ktedonobacteria bacterium brp13]|nr:hypothetical protein ccbrp13_70430 [Ktedonobacteria bacterium brp13]
MSSYDTRETVACVNETVVPLVHAFRELQDVSGKVVSDLRTAQTVLNRLRHPVRKAYSLAGIAPACADAFEADVEAWLERGLDSAPQFDQSLASFVTPGQGELTFFIAPFLATNGPAPRGAFLECFLALHEEPAELAQVTACMSHPDSKSVCSAGRILAGSQGLMSGNCVVFFPENVATARKVESQSFSFFFLNKFQRIFLSETLVRARSLFAEQCWSSEKLTPEQCYSARAIWCYVHDYFHQCGPRPFDSNLQVKMNFFVGLLEETKVDCQAAIAAYNDKVPFGREIVEFILLERLLRYPHQPDAPNNFDAGCGLFLSEWLLQEGYGLYELENGARLDIDACMVGMKILAEKIEAFEYIADNKEYRLQAKAFVRTLLPEGTNGERFVIPERYTRMTRSLPASSNLLHFADLPY